MATPQLIPFPEIESLADFSEIIDVRSPSEYAEDHVPGAINLPVLDDEERKAIGTLYHQTSKFAARRAGAAIIARNISRFLETRFAETPPDFQPLVYCWRGGQRSNSFATIFGAVGWHVRVVDGGYKSYRKWVMERLETWFSDDRFPIVLVGGLTGSGKTDLLHRMQKQGHQVIDLEKFANHRGSIFGNEPHSPQPHQKWFESQIVEEVRKFELGRPVFIESESHRIGNLYVPGPLWKKMKASRMIEVEVDLEERVRFLAKNYAFLQDDIEQLIAYLNVLRRLQGNDAVDRWIEMVKQEDWSGLARSLLVTHYDAAYQMSRSRFEGTRLGQVKVEALDEDGIDTGIEEILRICEGANSAVGN